MVLSDEKVKEYSARLIKSRMRILYSNGFYGLLLMHVTFTLDESCHTASTDGYRIYFGPAFLDSISDSELDFILMHEILHIVLQHCLRTGNRDNQRFNIACDIVVNSNILQSNNMDLKSITLSKYGESMHIAPDGKEGFNYTAEEVYEMLPASPRGGKSRGGGNGKKGAGSISKAKDEKTPKDGNKTGSAVFEIGRAGTHSSQAESDDSGSWDDHSRWTFNEEDTALRDVWVKHIQDALESISIKAGSNSRGILPMFAQRILKDLKKPQTDWRMILNDFVQEEVCDYTFSPPDRRFGESPFFLPDFNGTEDTVRNILFMIDTSASMSDDMITAAYSEIKGAIDQFDGRLSGSLGFFDAAIIEPVPFMDESEFLAIKAAGGGGTDFQIIFEYVAKYMQDDPPASIVILTDGYAPFPDISLTNGIPVLWIINNDEVDPPWGKVARIK